MSDTVDFALKLRCYSLEMAHRARASHIGGCLSCADILAHLYGGWLRVDPVNPGWTERDRFILSKGHAAAVLYAALALRGFFPLEWLESYHCNGARLGGNITRVPGVEVSTGSLGHGLPIGVGMALGARRMEKAYRVVVLMSDGDCNEGATWEAALIGATHNLENLLAIVDYNKIQALGRVGEAIVLEPLARKFQAFGWAVREIDGHDHKELNLALSDFPFEEEKPCAIIAHTVKGKGVSFMENRLEWHYKPPSKEQLAMALAELREL